MKYRITVFYVDFPMGSSPEYPYSHFDKWDGFNGEKLFDLTEQEAIKVAKKLNSKIDKEIEINPSKYACNIPNFWYERYDV